MDSCQYTNRMLILSTRIHNTCISVSISKTDWKSWMSSGVSDPQQRPHIDATFIWQDKTRRHAKVRIQIHMLRGQFQSILPAFLGPPSVSSCTCSSLNPWRCCAPCDRSLCSGWTATLHDTAARFWESAPPRSPTLYGLFSAPSIHPLYAQPPHPPHPPPPPAAAVEHPL